MNDDGRWMAAALALSERGRGRTWPNPCVGCVIVRDGHVVGRGWTQPGGRPHAEAMAVAQAAAAAQGATAYVTLEPCATHGRGPACSNVLIDAGVARVVIAIQDPFAAVDGKGFARLRAAGIDVTVGPGAADAKRVMAGFLTRQRLHRPHITLKFALSIDGCIAVGSGESQWITGPEARAHGHVERARADAIIVGRGTYEADAPRLDVRLPGLEERSPQRIMLTTRPAPDSWTGLASPAAVGDLNADLVLVEGGAGAASAFLKADLVDRLLVYRAPIVIGGGKSALHDIGLGALSDAHGRWAAVDSRKLGVDRLDIYERVRD